jgi:hypothetical protein
MARDPSVPPESPGGTSLLAWAYLSAGCGLILLGAILPGRDEEALEVPRAILLGAGLISLGAAVARRLRTAPNDVESRIITGSLILTAGFGVVLAYLGTPDKKLFPDQPDRSNASAVVEKNVLPEKNLLADLPDRQWDSIRMFLGVLAAVTFVGAGLVVLPLAARKVVVSLLVLLHFTSIFVSVTSVPPPNSAPPWLSVQAWYYVFRPYSSFMYLNNAYHFYSPEPGPPTLAWFYVNYDDGTGRWLKLPSHKDSPVPMHFQRLLALTESINVVNHNIPPDYDNLIRARRLAGELHKPEIPLPVDTPPTLAYQPLEQYSRIMVSAYVRHVARTWPHPDNNPDAKVTSIKAYRLIHQIIDAPHLAQGLSPNDETSDWPYYLGEFDPDGTMKNETDPFLYFWLPIRWMPQANGGPALENCLEIHATTKPQPAEEAKP